MVSILKHSCYQLWHSNNRYQRKLKYQRGEGRQSSSVFLQMELLVRPVSVGNDTCSQSRRQPFYCLQFPSWDTQRAPVRVEGQNKLVNTEWTNPSWERFGIRIFAITYTICSDGNCTGPHQTCNRYPFLHIGRQWNKGFFDENLLWLSLEAWTDFESFFDDKFYRLDRVIIA